MAINWDSLVLAPVMGIFGEDQLPRYTSRNGVAFDLADAVYDSEYQDIIVQDDMSSVTQSRPVLGVRLSLFALPPKQNDKVFIPSVNTTFVVSDVRPDGHGHAKLILMQAAAVTP
jgi:hypothetical protein